jgi:hypothetical protein
MPIEPALLERLVREQVKQDRSIYAATGAPEPGLRGYYGAMLVEVRQIKSGRVIDVVLEVRPEVFDGMKPEMKKTMTRIAQTDAYRHLVAGGIDIGSHGWDEARHAVVLHPRTVKSLAKVRKLAAAWQV